MWLCVIINYASPTANKKIIIQLLKISASYTLRGDRLGKPGIDAKTSDAGGMAAASIKFTHQLAATS